MAAIWKRYDSLAINPSVLKPPFKAHSIASCESPEATVFSVFELALVHGTVRKSSNTMAVAESVLKLSNILRAVDKTKVTDTMLSSIIVPFTIIRVADRVGEFLSCNGLRAQGSHFQRVCKEFCSSLASETNYAEADVSL